MHRPIQISIGRVGEGGVLEPRGFVELHIDDTHTVQIDVEADRIVVSEFHYNRAPALVTFGYVPMPGIWDELMAGPLTIRADGNVFDIGPIRVSVAGGAIEVSRRVTHELVATLERGEGPLPPRAQHA
jgi:hypothetical protein